MVLEIVYALFLQRAFSSRESGRLGEEGENASQGVWAREVGAILGYTRSRVCARALSPSLGLPLARAAHSLLSSPCLSLTDTLFLGKPATAR